MVLKKTQNSVTLTDSMLFRNFPLNEKFLFSEIDIEKKQFSIKKKELINNHDYVGKYVAIKNKEIIDVDSNEHELLKRVYAKHGYIPILVEKISDEENEYTTSPNFEL